MPTIRPILTQTLILPGYCNHVHELHDGQTRYLLADIEEYGTKRSTVQLWRLNYYKEPDEWELLWDLTRDEPWDSARRKPGAGHSIALNPLSLNLIIGISWKGLGESDGTSGVTMLSFARADIPPLAGQTLTKNVQSSGESDHTDEELQTEIDRLKTEVAALHALIVGLEQIAMGTAEKVHRAGAALAGE